MCKNPPPCSYLRASRNLASHMNKHRQSFFRRIRHFLAWDGWIVRRELPEGFRLRRHVVLFGFGMVIGFLALSLISGHIVIRKAEESLSILACLPVPFAVWFLLRCIGRFCCRFDSKPVPKRMMFVDCGRIFAGLIRPTFVVWVMGAWLLSLIPVRQSEPPRWLIANWLFDDSGNMRNPICFPYGSHDLNYCPSDFRHFLPDPSPEKIKLTIELESFPNLRNFDALQSLLKESTTNCLDIQNIESMESLAYLEWKTKWDTFCSRISAIDGLQTDRFVVSDDDRLISGFVDRRLLSSDLVRELSLDLAVSVDSDDPKKFAKAIDNAFILRDACTKLRGDIVSPLVAGLIHKLALESVLRFVERKEIGEDGIALLTDEIESRPPPDFSRRALFGMADDLLVRYRFRRRRLWQETGCMKLFGRPRFDRIRFSIPYSRFERMLGGVAMTLLGCSFRRYDVFCRELISYAVAEASIRLDEPFIRNSPHFRNSLDKCVIHDKFKSLAEMDSWLFGEWYAAWYAATGGGEYMSPRDSRKPMAFRNANPHIEISARFQDEFRSLMDAALLLARFRIKFGHDAWSLAEAAKKNGEVFQDVDSDFVELRYVRLEMPFGATSGSSAYALALVPKSTAPEWFRKKDRIEAWIVVRNPAFPGTRRSRIYTLERFGEEETAPPNECLVAVEETADAGKARFVVPDALFGSDEKAIAAAERKLDDGGWKLK